MSSQLAVKYLAEEDYPAWNRLVARSPSGSIYSTPEYLDVLCSVVGGHFRVLSVWRGDECVGGVALYEVRTRLGTLVKRSEAAGLQFTEDSDFDSFYALHRQTTQRKHTSVYLSESAFRTYFEALRKLDLCRLFHARQPDGRSISAQLVLLGPHPVSHTVCAAADEQALKLGATPFLRWRSFEALSLLGCTGNDLTDAALNLVTRFKSQLSGDLEMGLQITQPSLVNLARTGLHYLRAAHRHRT